MKFIGEYSIPPATYVGLVDSFFHEGRSLLIGATVVVLAMAACFMKTGHWSFALLVTVFALVTSVRFLGIQYYRNTKQVAPISVERAEFWEVFYTVGATLSMMLLGFWCFAAFAVTDDGFVQLISFTTTVAYSIGVFGRNFGIPSFVTLQALVVWVPMASGLAFFGGPYHWVFAVLLAVLFVGFKFIADRLRAILLDSLDARHRAETALVSAKSEAEKATAARARAISLLKKLRQSRRSEREAIETRDRHMRFLATMSHEIRTPLNGIVGALDILKEAEAEKVPRLLSVATGSAEALLEIVSEVLDLARLEYGDTSVENRPFEIREVVRVLRFAVLPIAKQKRLELRFELDDNLPKTVCGDPARIRQVLMNLVGNALKFTDSGHVALCWRVIGEEPGRVRTMISVEDTGIGISRDDLKKIYSPYFTSSDIEQRAGRSSGLGLAIAKKAVEMMGGELECESTPGVGTTFSLVLEFDVPAHSEERVDSGPASSVVEKEGARILLVEDNDTNAMLVEDMLSATQHAVERACGGLEAVELATTNPYDLVLMDISMPDLDGERARERICEKLEGGPRPKFVALTANAVAGDRERFLEAGFDAYLAKPVRKAELVRTVTAMLAESALPAAAESGPVAGEGPLDEALFAEFVSERSPERALKLLTVFQAELKRNGGDAAEAFKAGDVGSMKLAFHTIVGMASAIGAVRLTEMARRYEGFCNDGPAIAEADMSLVSQEIDDVLARTTVAMAELQGQIDNKEAIPEASASGRA